MSHGAMPLSGLNTAPAVAKLIHGLHHLELAAAKNPGRDEYLGWPSFTPTVIQAPATGAPQLNVMPGEARILVDIRTIPGQFHPGIINDLEALAAEIEQQVREDYRTYDRLLELKRTHDLKIAVQILTDRPCICRGSRRHGWNLFVGLEKHSHRNDGRRRSPGPPPGG
jgi:succinyl-diaminopimelate desuccinylase